MVRWLVLECCCDFWKNGADSAYRVRFNVIKILLSFMNLSGPEQESQEMREMVRSLIQTINGRY